MTSFILRYRVAIRGRFNAPIRHKAHERNHRYESPGLEPRKDERSPPSKRVYLALPDCDFLQLEAAQNLRSLARCPPFCAHVPGGHTPELVPGPDGVPLNCAVAGSARPIINSNAAKVIVVKIFDINLSSLH
jgi:hypothetical protein